MILITHAGQCNLTLPQQSCDWPKNGVTFQALKLEILNEIIYYVTLET